MLPTASSKTVGDGVGCRPFKPSTARAELLILKEQRCAHYHLTTLKSSPTSESSHFSHLHQTRAVSALVLSGRQALTGSLCSYQRAPVSTQVRSVPPLLRTLHFTWIKTKPSLQPIRPCMTYLVPFLFCSSLSPPSSLRSCHTSLPSVLPTCRALSSLRGFACAVPSVWKALPLGSVWFSPSPPSSLSEPTLSVCLP